MVDEELDQLLEGTENVDVDAFMDDVLNIQEDHDNRIEQRSDKKSLKVEIDADMVNISNDDVEEESAGDDFELRRRDKGKGIEETKDTPPPTPIRSPRTHIAPLSSDKETLKELTVLIEDAPSSADKEKLKELTIKFEKITTATTCRPSAIHPRDHEDHQDNDAHPERENSAKRQKMTKYGTYIMGLEQIMMKSLLKKCYKNCWKKCQEMSREIDEAKLQNAVDEMLRQRCNSGKEHQYHVDQMLNYFKNNIVWESRKDWLSLPTSKKKALVVHSCQRDPKAPTMTLLNQDLFYLKDGNSRQKKYTLSLHKFPTVPFSNDDMEEQTLRWVNQFHIRRQKEQRENPERLYSDSKIVEVIRTSYELGHEHKFITELIVRRANGMIDPITKQDYTYLNNNDIKDLYMLCINGKVDDYRETGLMGLENSKKEKRVTIHKFCDRTLKSVLERLRKYNKDVKYEYVDPSLSNADAEYLRYYKEDIEDRLKHRDQMRRWEMYVNGKPFGSRRDRL
ncbi:hypothetical protein Tco_0122136 [Tanacetum coccineum]